MVRSSPFICAREIQIRKLRELVMFIEDADGNKADTVLLVITGDLDLNQIAKITQENEHSRPKANRKSNAEININQPPKTNIMNKLILKIIAFSTDSHGVIDSCQNEESLATILC